MASSTKALFLLLCVFAVVLFISSQVSASNDQTKETVDTKGTVGVGEAKYGYGNDNPPYGGGGGGYNNGGGRGGNGGYYGGGGYCRRGYGCCRGYRNQPGCRCCSYATEAPYADFEDVKH